MDGRWVGGVRGGSEMEATVSATLRLVREGIGLELWRGKFDVSVDRERIGSIELHDTVETPVEPGHHTLRVQRSERFLSRERSFDVADEQVVSFRCHSELLWPMYVAALIKPDLGIILRRA